MTPEQLRNRSWWTGAEVFVLVDDYDLVATQQSSPVAPLQPLLAQARDVGLHVVVARRSGGASRALYEPVIQSLRDLAMPGLMLSGPRDEGLLIGNLRPQPAPEGRGRARHPRPRRRDRADGLERPDHVTRPPRTARDRRLPAEPRVCAGPLAVAR